VTEDSDTHLLDLVSRAFFFKVGEGQLKNVPIEITRYVSNWKQAYVYVEPGKTKVKDCLPLFEMAYKRVTGE